MAELVPLKFTALQYHGFGSQVNKFEPVSSDGHQLSVAGAGPGLGGPMSDVYGELGPDGPDQWEGSHSLMAGGGPGEGVRALYSKVQCIT